MIVRFLAPFISASLALLCSCATANYATIEDLRDGKVSDKSIYLVNKMLDLRGDTLILPQHCTLVFKNGGSIRNGTIIGNNAIIRYERPFIDDSVSITGCKITGKRVIIDREVFISIAHTQNEIQTLFGLSGGTKVLFTKGVYENIDRIAIDSNIEADFNNSTIKLYKDKTRIGECFFMEPWVDSDVDYVKIRNLTIEGAISGIKGIEDKRCIQLFHVSEVELENITIDKYYGGPQVFKSDATDLLDKSRIGTCAIAIMKYDRCTINNCKTNDINKEIFWCVPNDNEKNITFFTNNISTCSFRNGSSSFFTILDGRCIIKNNKVFNYNGSAFNAFCYDSEIVNNEFYDGKRSVAIDLSEGVMYRAKNVVVHDNKCYNTYGLVAAFGEDLRIKNNRWINNDIKTGERCYIITVLSRGKREQGGLYIGCNNNLEQGVGSVSIVIDNNNCINNVESNEREVRFALLYGRRISFSHNNARGLNVPVVQMVEGDGFDYCNNNLEDTRKGQYAELLINNGTNLRVINNIFSQNLLKKDFSCTVHVMSAAGGLVFKRNTIIGDANRISKEGIYIPCYVQDDSKLSQVDYFIDRKDNNSNVKTGLGISREQIRSNIVR